MVKCCATCGCRFSAAPLLHLHLCTSDLLTDRRGPPAVIVVCLFVYLLVFPSFLCYYSQRKGGWAIVQIFTLSWPGSSRMTVRLLRSGSVLKWLLVIYFPLLGIINSVIQFSFPVFPAPIYSKWLHFRFHNGRKLNGLLNWKTSFRARSWLGLSLSIQYRPLRKLRQHVRNRNAPNWP